MPDVASSWAARHDAIVIALKTPTVARALTDLETQCRGKLSRLRRVPDDEEGHDRSGNHSLNVHSSPRRLGRELDLALAVLWSANGIPAGKDPNPFRASASPHLRSLTRLSFSIDDFKSLKTLQRSSGSFVEVVRCKLNQQLYVLKTIVKGFIKRNAAIQSPLCETLFLAKKGMQAGTASEGRRVTPELLAAFQTQGSVHVVMEYIPSGDLSELLIAASKCGPEYPGRASTGLLVEDWIRRYAVDMVLAIAWMHGKGYAHRDIKPGNFLLDRSGHLKLCDFSSAAPFSQFEVAEPTLDGERVLARKVHRFYCSLPTGTCDYLSPELLEAEEERLARRQLSFRSFDEGDLPWKRLTAAESKADDVEPGPYGPEMDWWSLGIMLFEMRLGVLPFFSDQMQTTYELIRNHRETLRFDSGIEVSEQLKDLIQGLITEPLKRLGRTRSLEVQQHSFFGPINWNAEWPLEPPFVPNVGDLGATEGAVSSTPGPDREISMLHSPHIALPGDVAASGSLSAVDTLPDFSALYSGELDDFPAYMDSRDMDQPGMTSSRSYDLAGWSAEISRRADADVGHAAPEATFGLPRSSSSPAIVDTTLSPTPARGAFLGSLPSSSSKLGNFSTPRWSDCDFGLVGFSYVPAGEAFQPPELQPRTLIKMASAIPRSVTYDALSCAPSSASLFSDLGASPSVRSETEPMASTPQQRPNGKSSLPDIDSIAALPSLPSYVASPAEPWSAERVPAEPDSTAEPAEDVPRRRFHSFVTPARKPSYMCLADLYAASLEGNSQAPTPGSAEPRTQQTPAMSNSKYPFPMVASESMPSVARKRALPLRRNDLARARSATPGAGSVGSDSRYSGGSNAVREVSESQAWDEMMAAVQKSVRKQQQRENESPSSTWPRRQVPSPAVQRTSNVSNGGSVPRRRLSDPAGPRGGPRLKPTVALPSLATIAPSPDAKISLRDATQEEHCQEIDSAEESSSPSRRLVKESQRSREGSLTLPLAMDRDPLGELSNNDMPFATRFPSPQPIVAFCSYYDSDSSSSSSDEERKVAQFGIKHKRSARQLLIKAQERSTPTKPARTQSPSLTEAHAARLAGVSRGGSSSPLSFVEGAPPFSSSPREDDVGPEAGRSALPRSRPISILTAGGRLGSNSPANCSAENLSSSSGHGSLGKVPTLGAITLLEPICDIVASGRLDSAFGEGSKGDRRSLHPETSGNREIRRRSSRDMLSEYRRGIGRPNSMSAVKAPYVAVSSPGGLDDAFSDRDSAAAASQLGEGPPKARGERRRFSSAIIGRGRPSDPVAASNGLAKQVGGSHRDKRRSDTISNSRATTEAPTANPTAETKDPARAAHKTVSANTARTVTRRLSSLQLGGSANCKPFPRTSEADSPVQPIGARSVKGTTSRTRGERPMASYHSLAAPISHTTSASTSAPASVSTGSSRKEGADVRAPTEEASAAAATGMGQAEGDVSLMTGLRTCHTALQGSLMELEVKLAQIKKRLEK